MKQSRFTEKQIIWGGGGGVPAADPRILKDPSAIGRHPRSVSEITVSQRRINNLQTLESR
jgi:hypothetical protein